MKVLNIVCITNGTPHIVEAFFIEDNQVYHEIIKRAEYRLFIHMYGPVIDQINMEDASVQRLIINAYDKGIVVEASEKCYKVYYLLWSHFKL